MQSIETAYQKAMLEIEHLKGENERLRMAIKELSALNDGEADEEARHLLDKEYAKAILSIMIGRYKVTIEELKGKSRKKEIVFPRQLAQYLMNTYTGLLLREVGEYFGGRDHTTVIHSCQVINNWKDTDMDKRIEIAWVERIFKRKREELNEQLRMAV